MSIFNFCPNCASENFEFENNRRFECYECGMIYFHNVAAAVAVIIEKEDQILFVVRNKDPKKGFLDLPGGFTDPDETTEETCSRELKEELGIMLYPSDFHYFSSQPNNYRYKDIPYKTEDLVFTAKIPGNVKFELQKSEIQAVRWVLKSEINLEEIAFDSLRKAVGGYLGRSSQK